MRGRYTWFWRALSVSFITFCFFCLLMRPNVPSFSQQLELEKKLLAVQRKLDLLTLEDAHRRRILAHFRQMMEYSHIYGNFSFESSINLQEFHLDPHLWPPTIYDYLPHLLLNQSGLRPAIRISKERRNVQFVIGVPTCKRPRINYLVSTLRSLLDNLSYSQRPKVLIVVLIAEPGATSFAVHQSKMLQQEFPDEFQTGLLEVVCPSEFYYPDLEHLTPTFGDDIARMRWRTKQNLDYAWLLMYSAPRGSYYLQLEDDVVARENYLSSIEQFIELKSGENWEILEFSSLGFIGKLFRTQDLPVLATFLLMFYRDKPSDWLLDHLLYVHLCNPEKSPKQCNQEKQKAKPRHKPSLFQHVGVQSSLLGKTQKLREKDFGRPSLHVPHRNPPAKVSTSLKIYQKFSLERAYAGESYFWALLPQPGDWVKIDLTPACYLYSIDIRSGNAEHPDDIFYNTSLEIKWSRGLSDYAGYNKDWAMVGGFSEGGRAYALLNDSLLPVESVRLLVHSESHNWVIVSEIWLKPRF